MKVVDKIVFLLKSHREPLTQREISLLLPAMNRAVLLGYLRALVDLGRIRSKDSGRSKVYFL